MTVYIVTFAVDAICWPIIGYNIWKIRVSKAAARWYTNPSRGPKPKAVLTFERRWGAR